MWQPIKTAPKDGTWVLLKVKYFEAQMVVAKFEFGFWMFADDINDEPNDKVFAVFDDGYWMPLPELPNG